MTATAFDPRKASKASAAVGDEAQRAAREIRNELRDLRNQVESRLVELARLQGIMLMAGMEDDGK